MNFFSNQCFCGNSYGKFGIASSINRVCDIPCKGNSKQICGGAYANSIYVVPKSTFYFTFYHIMY